MKAVQVDGGMTFTFPEISKGAAVFWYEPSAEE
jgi:hypothetical protein